jgi:hypothetical protein
VVLHIVVTDANDALRVASKSPKLSPKSEIDAPAVVTEFADAEFTEVTKGASNEYRPIDVPAAFEMVMNSACGASAPATASRPARTCVAVTHATLAALVNPMPAVGVGFAAPKFWPRTVTLPPFVLGPLNFKKYVTVGASNENGSDTSDP